MGNANERAWETQKKTLYTRFSQSLPLLPSLNGYGELVGNLSNCADTNSCHPDSELIDTAAETFVRDGLSKVMKITNICDSEHLSDCGLPDKIIPLEGDTINLSGIKTMSGFNPAMIDVEFNSHLNYHQIDTKASAFETVNGESILVYYNPNCEPDLKETDAHNAQTKLCANFVYDLNGKKGPNTVGKDIGFISAMYSTDPAIAAPNPYRKSTSTSLNYNGAVAACKEMGDDIKVPNLYDAMSIFYNSKLIFSDTQRYDSWTSAVYSSTNNWRVAINMGRVYTAAVSFNTAGVYCIKR